MVQRPALAGVHAQGANDVPDHIVVVAHHDPVLGIDNLALVALDVDNDHGAVERFDWQAVSRSDPVLGDGKESSPQAVQVNDSWRAGMRCCLTRRCLLLRTHGAIDAGCIPGGQVFGLRQAAEVVTQVDITSRFSI
jgi:hypothetical protein